MVEKEDPIGEQIQGMVELLSTEEAGAVEKFIEKIMEGISPPFRKYCVLIKTWEQTSGIIEVRWRVEYNPKD